MTADLLWQLARVGEPAVPEDGRFCVAPVTRYDVEDNSGRTRLWLLKSGEAPRALTDEKRDASQPALTADGRRLAFVRSVETDEASPAAAQSQLHLLELDGGEARQLTDLPLGVADPRWFPDGRRLAFIAPVYRDAMDLDETRARRDALADRKVSARVTEDRTYRFWDRWLTDGEVHHLFVLDVESGELRDLTPDSTAWADLMDPSGQFDISPDGERIVFAVADTQPPHDHIRTTLFELPAEGGERRSLTESFSSDCSHPRYSPDGKRVLFGSKHVHENWAEPQKLVALDLESGEASWLSESWDVPVSAWGFGPDGTLLVTFEERGRCVLVSLDSSGERKRLHAGSGFGTPRATQAGVFLLEHDLTRPPQITRVDAEGAHKLSDFNDGLLSEVEMSPPEDVEFQGADGDSVHMIVMRPVGAGDGPLPFVHLVHGGPYSHYGHSWHWRWNPQVFTAAGYAVALVNFHGSTSFGAEFANSIKGDWGTRTLADVEAATDLLIERGIADPERMAITGGSFGGYMAAWVTSQVTRYKCAVAHAAVYDLHSMYGSDYTLDIGAELRAEPWAGPEAAARLDAFDPAAHTGGFSTPTLVIHGEKDYRVPVGNGLSLYGVLKGKGVPARLVYYPDENHWILKPQNSLHWYSEFLGWLERWLS